MDSFRKLMKRILSFDLSTVKINDDFFYRLENMLYESNYDGEAIDLRNEAITDLLFLDEKIREDQIMRLKNTLDKFNEYISKHLDNRNLVGELYHYSPIFNISLNHIGDFTNISPIVTSNFAEDLNKEISIRFFIVEVLINGVINSIKNDPFKSVSTDSFEDFPDVKYLNIIPEPKVLFEVPFEVWNSLVYKPDNNKKVNNPIPLNQRKRMKDSLIIDSLEEMLSEKHSGRSSELIDLILNTDGPIANSNKVWIAPSYAANALFQVLLNYGIIKNVSKQTFANIISNEFLNLHNSFWTNKGGNDYGLYQKSFELSFSSF